MFENIVCLILEYFPRVFDYNKVYDFPMLCQHVARAKAHFPMLEGSACAKAMLPLTASCLLV